MQHRTLKFHNYCFMSCLTDEIRKQTFLLPTHLFLSISDLVKGTTEAESEKHGLLLFTEKVFSPLHEKTKYDHG